MGLVAGDQGWSSTGRVLGGRTIERSGDAVCSLHHAQGDEERMFSWFSLKTKVDDFFQIDLKFGG
jgi:hypothetical protein